MLFEPLFLRGTTESKAVFALKPHPFLAERPPLSQGRAQQSLPGGGAFLHEGAGPVETWPVGSEAAFSGGEGGELYLGHWMGTPERRGNAGAKPGLAGMGACCS